MKRLRYDLIGLLFVAILLVSCALGKAEQEASYDYYEDSKAPKLSRSEAEPAAELMADNLGNSTPDGDSVEQDSSDTGGGEVGRKRIYNGSAEIVVEDLNETRQSLESLTLESGGYVESSYGDYLVLRIPAELFDETFSAILDMGRVNYSRVETWDITEAFADIERRLSTAEETRRRLYTLLEQSTDSQERAKILKEIGRLTEEIESLKQQVSVMEARISFSRITIQLIPRIQGEISRENIPFPWIANLDPLYPAGDKLKGRITLKPGEDFAVFSRESIYMAENSSGTQILVSTVDNSPFGDNGFWQKALTFHLGPYYSTTTELEISFGEKELLGVELVSKDREPFRYFIGIVQDGRNLHVIEIFSPTAAVDFQFLYDSMAQGVLK